MSERWKPEEGDTFWYVSALVEVAGTTWQDDEIDPVFYKTGNCFRTDKEAAAAAEKVKALLLSLQDNGNNLVSNSPDKGLPEWVTVGGYVYDPKNGYGQVVRESGNYCFIEFGGGAGNFAAEDFAEFKQARLRPYNKEELRLLIGKVVCECDGVSLLLVTGYNEDDDCGMQPAVRFLGEWTTAEELCRGDYSIDGHPCGVLEHLENGEWVE